MFRAIEKFISFAVKVLVVGFIFAWIEQVLGSLINGVMQKLEIRGRDPRDVKADEMEKYYMAHGVQCSKCKCWVPVEFDRCPVCMGKGASKTAPAVLVSGEKVF